MPKGLDSYEHYLGNEQGYHYVRGYRLDLSSATNVEIHFSAPGITTVNSASVSVLAANTTTSACGVFSANKAVEYITNSGDFSMSADRQQVTVKGWIVADFYA